MPQHNVRDTDTRFTVDPITRAIVNVSQKKTVLIQNDHNSERFTFEIPRYIEAHDMSLCNKVEIHYINIDAVTKMQTEGLYPCDDFGVDPDDDNKVTCSWLISANATQYVGSLAFAVNLQCSDGEKILYRWNTLPNNSVRVSDGINNTEIVVEKYADILQMWWDRLYANANMRIQPVTYDEFVELTNNGQVENGTLYLLTDDPLFGDVGNLQQGMSAVWNAINQNTENIKDSIKKGEVLGIGSGGTGAKTAEQARENLGITLDGMEAASKTHKHDANDIYSGMLDKARLPEIPENKLPTIPTEKGGTGASDKINACKNLGAAMVGAGEKIEAYANLDTFTTTGTYRSPNKDISGTLKNTPYKLAGFKLEVFSTASGDTWIQEIKANSRMSRTFRRSGSKSGGWQKWHEVFQLEVTTDPPTTTLPIDRGGTGATTVEDARTNLGVPATSDLESGKIIVNKSTYSTYAEQATKATNATNATNAKILDPDNVINKDVEYVNITANGLYMVEFKVTDNIYASSIIYIRTNKDCLGSTTHDAVKDMPMYASFSMATKKLTVINPIGNTYTIIKVQRLVSN